MREGWINHKGTETTKDTKGIRFVSFHLYALYVSSSFFCVLCGLRAFVVKDCCGGQYAV